MLKERRYGKIVFSFFCVMLLLLALTAFTACLYTPDDQTNVGGSSESESVTDPDETTPLELSLDGFRIVVPADADRATSNAAEELASYISAATGKQLAVGTDADETTEYEIVVGASSRPLSAAALDGAGTLVYAVGYTEGKFVINATKSELLDGAVEYFIGQYLSPVRADGKLSFYEAPIHISAEHREVTLIDGGKASFTKIVYTDSVCSEIVDACKSISAAFKTQTGKDVLTGSDTLFAGETYNSRTAEILVGHTDYSETAAAKTCLASAESYGIFMQDNKLCVLGYTERGTLDAVKRLNSLIAASAVRGSDDTVTVKLYINNEKNYSETGWFTSIPQFTGGTLSGGYDCGDDTLLYYFSDSSAQAFADYSAALTAAGAALYTSHEADGSLFATYEKGNYFINIQYFAKTSIFKIITEPKRALPPVTAESYTKTNEPSITTLGLTYMMNFGVPNDDTAGMGFIVKLEDGSFLIIDGGNTDDHEVLYNELMLLSGGAKPHIRAWIITHNHPDHLGAMHTFASTFADRVTLDLYIGNHPSRYINTTADEWVSGRTVKDIAMFEGAQWLKIHVGTVLKFPGVELEFLHTHEEIYPEKVDAENDQSLVFRITLGGQTVMILGDSQEQAGNCLIRTWGAYLKTYFVQIAHHGSKWCPTVELYKLIAPKYCFYPAAIERKTTNASYPTNVYLFTESSIEGIYFSDDGNHTYTFPYNG